MIRYPIPSNLDSEVKAYLEYLQNTIATLEQKVLDLETRLTQVDIKSKSKQTLNKN